jgi:hypothetical protein
MKAAYAVAALLGIVRWLGVSPAPPQADPCGPLYPVLAAVPHDSLTRADGALESTWDGHAFVGCQVDFVTTDSTLNGATAPDFFPDEGSDAYRAGWRMIPDILADGAGSGVYGITRGTTRCVVDWQQPAYLDDDGTIVQSDTFTMRIQCENQGQ